MSKAEDESNQKQADEVTTEFMQYKAQICSNLRPRTHEVGEALEVMLPMEDGVKLKTFIQFPKGEGPFPVMFERTPYLVVKPNNEIYAQEVSARGYVYIYQHCRGIGESEGEWSPFINERSDGLAALKWIAQQPWSEGIGMVGASYGGIVQWLVSDILPPEVKTLFMAESGVERYHQYYQEGSFRHDIGTIWAMTNAGEGVEVKSTFEESAKFRPHVNVDTKLWGCDLPWYRQWVTSTDFDSAFWQSGTWKALFEAPRGVKVPICIFIGWYDIHIAGAIRAYESLPAESREKSTLIITTSDHMRIHAADGQEMPEEIPEMPGCPLKSTIEWFDKIFLGKEGLKKEIKAAVFGEKKFVHFENWPLPSKPKTFYFGKNVLVDQMVENSFLEYTYDPNNPVETVGGDGLMLYEKKGSTLQPEPFYRADVLTFLSEPLTERLSIAGNMKVKLYTSSNAEDTAFTVRVMELEADGKAYNIRDSITTMAYRNEAIKRVSYTPNEVVELNFRLRPIAWTFKTGSKLRIDISSSDFPQYSVHTNYAGVWSEQANCKTANQKIFIGTNYPSSIEIPVSLK